MFDMANKNYLFGGWLLVKYFTMKNANSHDKPSPSDDATTPAIDNGKESKIRKEDKQYHAEEPENKNIAKKHENEEQPDDPIINPPKDK
jgi:hypothetical protein